MAKAVEWAVAGWVWWVKWGESFFQLLELGYEKFPHNTTVALHIMVMENNKNQYVKCINTDRFSITLCQQIILN